MNPTLVGRLIALYVAVSVFCFGPALKHSEHKRAESIATCRAERAGLGEEAVRGCTTWAYDAGEAAAAKAAMWPWWLSVVVADRLSQ